MTDKIKIFLLAGISIIFATATIMGLGVSYRYYSVWSAGMKGKAELARAEQNRQIQIFQAAAEKESAQLRAEAISIIGEAAQKYPEYRHQEFIGAFAEALKEGKINQIIYVPTETNIPILEAGKNNK